jgi:hypothetical protein
MHTTERVYLAVIAAVVLAQENRNITSLSAYKPPFIAMPLCWWIPPVVVM